MASSSSAVGDSAEISAGSIKMFEKDLSDKKKFCATCAKLAQACERVDDMPETIRESIKGALTDTGKRMFTILQSRFTNPKFWQAGLEFFLALEFHVPAAAEQAGQWRDAAMQEVDEDAREQAEIMKEKRRIEGERKFNQGQFSDANTPVTQAEFLAGRGYITVDADDARPGMSRDAVHELRLITIQIEDVCPICQEIMPVGSKAKCMPCGHKFHDDCLISWVAKNNTCPMCRFDELPSEKHHFDDVERRIQKEDPCKKGIFS